eukprot:Phypoly_transcript_06472.p1 GENE.Phypoly_transcript_06472~~Phypoly_transcript_06472.p1  ORF type:complete len:230 (+),score=36.71 Phypoly_transcript_06472:997-1686(+)
MSSSRASEKDLPTVAVHPQVAGYLESVSLRTTKVQDELHKVIVEHPRGVMSSTRTESQFLAWMVKLTGAKRVIEVGVFLGATTLAIAQALPENGKVLALDVSEEFTSIGAKYWKDAGVAHKIDLVLKPAVEVLKERAENPSELNSYDFAFIDADKPNYDAYYEYCLKLVKVGGVIAVDNTLWHGRVVDKEDQSTETIAIRTLNEKIHKDQRVDITFLCIADGVTLCRKL